MKHFLLVTVQTESLIKLLEIIIWPLTLFLIILMFRKQFRNAMERMGSFKADATGISMSFEPKLDAAKKIFSALKPEGVSKSATSLHERTTFTGTPKEQLGQMKAELHTSLVELAQEANLDSNGKSTSALNRELAQKSIVKNESYHLIEALLEVINAAPAAISQAQVSEIQEMYNSI
ncbi:MAG: hypothetical protein KJO05_01655 [Bacteroidia bacterium]|nr:hypothetical protein [Bacteroidia bacterium]NNF31383.1 hypothetical protein [Flavobacteriaceae bacterium]MBT8275950.1 hypothetical protein [Bacteroidia bacterium]NNJ81919.1 hypothetical protein [Flavobacteriaceae bacterium]NNK53025.1 hypothetical protein [Flavobacteriaceae bacterium]